MWRLWLLGVVSCGPMGTAQLTVEFADRTQIATGTLVIVTATDEDGTIGSGAIHLTATAGSLAESDFTLDAFGRARTSFTCNVAMDPGCASPVTVTATWVRQKETLSAEASVNVMSGGSGAGGGTGAGHGTSGGGGGTGGSGGGPSCGMSQCANVPNIMFLQTLLNGGAANGWGPVGGPLESTNVSTTQLLPSSTCSNGECTTISIRGTDPRYPNAPPTISYLLESGGQGTHPTTSVAFGGSMDVPVLRSGSVYVDGKRNPPVPYQPYFDASYCGGRPNVTQFTICRLEASGTSLNEVVINFDSICVGATHTVRGCIHYTR